MVTATQTAHTNRLINEKSPYLLQHAHNPVNWYPWGDEAFNRAKAEDKPVFLSIGYSTCHWCHVMERESFEDKQVADLLNEGFVSIKVDREERPDVDAFYMDACMALNGSGGWPLSCFLTPDRKPFFTGTYFPKGDGPYGIGFLSVLRQVNEAWRNRRKEATDFADSIVSHINREEEKSDLEPGREDAAFRRLEERFDPEYGGFGGAPKFPSLPILAFLMRYGLVNRESRAFDMVRTTLNGMARGGIHDAIGGGFCRYSTDRRWLVPHFEKMMTDNALHILAYSEASALFGGAYAETARETVRFCTRHMLDRAGGFYTATDSDSEGEEGKFYVFTPEEITGILGTEDGRRFCEYYHITDKGNFEGKSIPNRIGDVAEADAEWLRQCTEKVLAFREKRVPPARDDKALSLVNGLMTAALAAEGRILGDNQAVEAARHCARFLLSELVQDGRLLSRWRDGEAGIPASSDDYACLIWGLLELYETTFEPEWLEQALLFTEKMNTLFLDDREGGYFLSGSDVKELPARQKIFYDGAAPSGNSVMAMNLLRLSRLCAERKYEEEAVRILNLAAPILNGGPDACCGLLCSLLYLKDGGTEVILADGDGFDSLKKAIPPFSPFLSTAVCGTNYQGITAAAPYLKDYPNAGGAACAYVCRKGSCQKPVTSAQSLSRLLTAE